MKSGLTVVDKSATFFGAIEKLTTTRVMVGVPAEKTDRRSEGNHNLTNAALAYIHENGAPEANIPARPFLRPGIDRAKGVIVAGLKNAGQLALRGDSVGVDKQLHAVGLLASSSVKTVITEGIPPPLAASTVAGRIARRKSAKWRAERRAAVAANVVAGAPPGQGLFVPLIDTGQLRNAITYVLRKVGKR